MRFLPFINGKLFLVIYAAYAILVMILLSKKLKANDDGYFVASSLDEEKYYILENKYNMQNLFYYITYKLYAKGILIKDEAEKSFYVNTGVKDYLSSIEEQVCCLYLDKFAPKDFKANMINESEFKAYYYFIYNELITNGFIKDSNALKKNKSTFKIGMTIMLIPGVWRLIGGIAVEMPVTALVIELIITFVIAIIIFQSQINNKLTNKGSASKRAYENQYKSIINNENNRNNNDEYYGDTMQDFFIGNSWMNFLGVSDLNKNNNDTSSFFDNSSFDFSDNNSSDSSSNNDSSGSSCSSCGGCGGGD